MILTMMKSKIHRATVTGADLLYEGSISLDPKLIKEANFFLHEKVAIYNCNNGERFSTYVIKGQEGEVCLNGAAARKVQRGDILIIVSYAQMTPEEASLHEPKVVFVNEKNRQINGPAALRASTSRSSNRSMPVNRSSPSSRSSRSKRATPDFRKKAFQLGVPI